MKRFLVGLICAFQIGYAFSLQQQWFANTQIILSPTPKSPYWRCFQHLNQPLSSTDEENLIWKVLCGMKRFRLGALADLILVYKTILFDKNILEKERNILIDKLLTEHSDDCLKNLFIATDEEQNYRTCFLNNEEVRREIVQWYACKRACKVTVVVTPESHWVRNREFFGRSDLVTREDIKEKGSVEDTLFDVRISPDGWWALFRLKVDGSYRLCDMHDLVSKQLFIAEFNKQKIIFSEISLDCRWTVLQLTDRSWILFNLDEKRTYSIIDLPSELEINRAYFSSDSKWIFFQFSDQSWMLKSLIDLSTFSLVEGDKICRIDATRCNCYFFVSLSNDKDKDWCSFLPRFVAGGGSLREIIVAKLFSDVSVELDAIVTGSMPKNEWLESLHKRLGRWLKTSKPSRV